MEYGVTENIALNRVKSRNIEVIKLNPSKQNKASIILYIPHIVCLPFFLLIKSHPSFQQLKIYHKTSSGNNDADDDDNNKNNDDGDGGDDDDKCSFQILSPLDIWHQQTRAICT